MDEQQIATIVAKVRGLGSFQRGSHDTPEDGVCINEAFAYAAGLPHSESPSCLPADVGRFNIGLNDSAKDDAQRWRELSPRCEAMLRASHDPVVAHRRGLMALDWLLRVCAPTWLRLVPSLVCHADTLAAMPAVTDASAAEFAGPARAARVAAWYAASDALNPTATKLRASALELLDRMLAVRNN